MKKENNLFKGRSGKFLVFVLILMLATSIEISGSISQAYEYDEFDEPAEPDPVVFKDSQGLTYDNTIQEEGDIGVDVVWGDQDKVSGKIVVPETIKDRKTGKTYKVISADGPFNLCTKVNSVVLPKTWNEISYRSFYGCTSLKSVTIKAKLVKYIETMAFTGCKNLTTIKNINKVKEIANRAFEGCTSLKKLKLDYVTDIGSEAFKNCKQLNSISIGKNLKVLGKNIFQGCKKLKTIVIKSTKLKKVNKKAFSGTSHKIMIKVPKKKLSAYRKMFKNTGNKKIVVTA